MNEPRSDPPADGATVAVLDIDGVVADVRHRLKYLRGRSRWDRFFAAAGDDPLLEVGARLAHELARSHRIVWLSGRPESLRAVTQAWLDGHGLPEGALVLRSRGDFRPAAQTKLELVREQARHGVVAAVIDDDPDVVAALGAAGFPVVLADWVPHEKTLHRAQEQSGRT